MILDRLIRILRDAATMEYGAAGVTILDADGNELPLRDDGPIVTHEGGGAAPAFTAIHLAPRPAPATIDALVAVYDAWNAQQGLKLGSADEHLHDEALTQTQRDWLSAYVILWDASL